MQLEPKQTAEPPVTIEIARDQESGVWFILSSTLPGLHVEGRTRDEVVENAKLATLDLLDAAAPPSRGGRADLASPAT